MIKEAIDRILALSMEGRREEIDGRQYYVAGGKMHCILDQAPDPITLVSLTALQDLVRDWIDVNPGFDHELLLHVAGPTKVRLVTALCGPWHQRHTIAVADAALTAVCDAIGKALSQEEMMVKLQAQFVRSEHVVALLSAVGSVKGMDEAGWNDDGVTQAVTVRRGAKLGTDTVKNPWDLRPYRTFLEVEQPESQFILRLRGGTPDAAPAFTLHEADGGAWKMKAVQAIREWLASNIPGVPVIA